MDLIEDFVRFVVSKVLDEMKEELKALERDTTYLEKVREPFIRMKYEDAVSVIKGEKDVNGKTSLQMLADEEAELKSQRAQLEADIAERKENCIGRIEKGEINFNQARIDKLKNEIKDLDEKLQNLPQWQNSARNFKRGDDFGVVTKRFLQKCLDNL